MKAIYFAIVLFVTPLSLFILFGEAKVEVLVRDNTDHAIREAKVSFYQDKELIKSMKTDFRGRVQLYLREGIYRIAVSKEGFVGQQAEGIAIQKREVKLSFILIEDNKDFPTLRWKDGDSQIDLLRLDSRKAEGATGFTSESSSFIAEKSKSGLPGSGLVTAGEWNDLNNWSAWKVLNRNDNYQKYQKTWGINTNRRFSINVINENHIPLPNVVVRLVDKQGQAVWESRTDLSGRAELWNNPFGESLAISHIDLISEYQEYRISRPLSIDQGSNIKILQDECPASTSLDIAFVVDATSSMSDEIRYLQAELSNVIKRAQLHHEGLRMASVFYRDHSESYLTKKQNFTDDELVLLDFIQEQNAQGGGDFPEAVSDALEVALNELKWRNNTAKILFLLCDAPPHLEEEYLLRYRSAIKKASARGIKIIPISASGINRDTEFLLKYTSMLTNGTYVFITDDSGIGNPHLKPVIEDYKVEKLNDLLVRLIKSYGFQAKCSEKEESNTIIDVKVFPNPAKNYLQVENMQIGDKIFLLSSSGKILISKIIKQDFAITLNLEDIISGTYYIRIIRDEEEMTKRVIIIT